MTLPTPVVPTKAGRTLDALIAEKVMGLSGKALGFPHPYSTDISAAWEVVERLREVRDCVSLTWDIFDRLWEVEVYDSLNYNTGLRHDGSAARGSAVIQSAETAPLAIGLAALATLSESSR